MSASIAKWFAITTAPRAEKKVALRLTEKQIENYLPLCQTIRKWSDRRKKVIVPLFNSYLFIKMPEAQLAKLFEIQGFIKVIKFGGTPAAIPEEQINLIKRILKENIPVETTQERLPKGTKVCIMSGPLIGTEGSIVEYKGNKRLVINLSHLNSNLVLTVADTDLEAIPESHGYLISSH